MSQSMRSIYETEKVLTECQSYIMQLRIDQKSMPPSNKKRELKNRICEYNANFYTLEQKFKKVQDNFKNGLEMTKTTDKGNESDSSNDSDNDEEKHLNSSCDMEFDSLSIGDKKM